MITCTSVQKVWVCVVDGRNRAGIPAPPISDPWPCPSCFAAVPACSSSGYTLLRPARSLQKAPSRPLSGQSRRARECPCVFNFRFLLRGQSQFQTRSPPIPSPSGSSSFVTSLSLLHGHFVILSSLLLSRHPTARYDTITTTST